MKLLLTETHRQTESGQYLRRLTSSIDGVALRFETGVTVHGTAVGESFGGIGLTFPEVACLNAGDELEVSIHGVHISAVVRTPIGRTTDIESGWNGSLQASGELRKRQRVNKTQLIIAKPTTQNCATSQA